MNPFTERFVGVSYPEHGSVLFDVPFMTEIAPNLWIGGCKSGLVLPTFIQHVVSLYKWEHYSLEEGHDVFSYAEVEMYDGGEVDTHQIDVLGRWVNSCRRLGPTLVHCQVGLNRSALVVATALALEGGDIVEVIDMLREKRSPAVLCNEAFHAHLLMTHLRSGT